MGGDVVSKAVTLTEGEEPAKEGSHNPTVDFGFVPEPTPTPTASDTPSETPVTPDTPTETPISTDTPSPTATPTMLPTDTNRVCVGDLIWNDIDDDGLYEPGQGEAGIRFVDVHLYEDTDGSGDYTKNVDQLVDTTRTNADGHFLFCGVPAGDYILVIPPSNFDSGNALENASSSSGNDPAADPDDDVDDDDNGTTTENGTVATRTFTLDPGTEPTDDGDGDPNTNRSVDFGFFIPMPTPTPTSTIPGVPSSTPTNTGTATDEPTATGTPVVIATATTMPTETNTLCVGDLVFKDLDDDGRFELFHGERGIANVSVSLYRDTDGNGRLTKGVDSLVDSTDTNFLGLYRFCGLAPGDYVVAVDLANFGPGGALSGARSSSGNEIAPDPDDNVNNDDNGRGTRNGTVSARAVTLSIGDEPTNDGDHDPNTNRTVDFGFVFMRPTPSPTPTMRPTDDLGTGTPGTGTPGSGTSTPVSGTPTNTATPSQSPTPSMTPTPPAFQLKCEQLQGDGNRLKLTWTDATSFETHFRIWVSVNGGRFVALKDLVSSSSMRINSQEYSYTTPQLPSGTAVRFKVQAVNVQTGQESTVSLPSSGCMTESKPASSLGCYSGKINLQGRADNGGAWILYDGFPITTTDANGNFSICGVKPGKHRVSADAACYLTSQTENLYVGAGENKALGYTQLYGGDIDANESVNLFDLVRVGAAYNRVPVSDPAADCNADGKVDLLDLVLVGSNYGIDGPLDWGWTRPAALAEDNLAEAIAISQQLRISGETADLPFAALSNAHASGSVDDAVRLSESRLDDEGNIVVDIILRDASAFYGTDLTLVFDPSKVEVVDAMPASAGTQIEPGMVWNEGESFIAANTVSEGSSEASHQIRFAASLMHPAAPVGGDVLLATVRFSPKVSEPGDAYAIGSALIADNRGRSIDASWSGFDIRSVGKLFLPWLNLERQ